MPPFFSIPKEKLGKRSLVGYLLVPQILPFALMLMVICSIIWGIDYSVRQASALNSAQQRLSIINQITHNVLDCETGLQGYMLTGNRQFLGPYRKAQAELQRNIGLLKAKPVTVLQYQNIQQVHFLMNSWRDQVAEPLLRVRQNGGSPPGGLELLSSEQGTTLIDQTQQVLAALETDELSRREEAMVASNSTLLLTRLLAVSGLLLAAALIWLAALRSAQALSKVLGEFNRDVTHIAQGHYDFQLPRLPITEVQQLGDQVEKMATAVRERELSLQRSNRELERSNRELEQFAYIASHDLQEPLRTIGSYTELLAKRYSHQLDDRADKYIRFTLSATHRLKLLIQDLLAFSRVRQPGRVMGLVNIQQLVDTILADLSTTLEMSQAELDIGTLPTLRGNPELLRHIFQNLLSNAIKFRDPQRPLKIGVYAVHLPTTWEFSVTDNGIGIEAEYFERIFGVFQRLSNNQVDGSGIGLAVVRTAIERHGGEISVSSTPGVGSTFTFTLPHILPTDDQDHLPLPTSITVPVGALGEAEGA